MDYTGKFLSGSWDNELYVMFQKGELLFCLSYSRNHEIISTVCYKVEDLMLHEKYPYSITEEVPYWFEEKEIERMYDDF